MSRWGREHRGKLSALPSTSAEVEGLAQGERAEERFDVFTSREKAITEVDFRDGS